MKRKIIIFLYNLFKNQHDRLLEREIRKIKLTDESLVTPESRLKIKIIKKNFLELMKQVGKNNTGKFDDYQIAELCLLKNQYNQLINFK